MKLFSRQKFKPISLVSGALSLAIALTGCQTQQSDQYEATARATMTWMVEYANYPVNDKRPRVAKFESVSLVNRNGTKPEGAVYQDDQGIWWPKEPPKPTIDQLEAGQEKSYEKIGKPRRLREVEYRVKFTKDGERLNLPTNHSVYRQVAKAYPNTEPLTFTLGVNNGSVTKATPTSN